MRSNSSRIVWRLHLRSKPERIYDLLATDDGRALFWAESAVEKDGVIHFVFINGVEARCPILERRSPDRFALEYFDSKVVFELTPDGRGGTDLTLLNTGFPPDDYEELLAGWLNVLFPLKAMADHGVDLRCHDASRTWEGGYADQ